MNTVAATQYHRKHAIHLLKGIKRFTKPQPKPRGPKPLYDPPELLKALRKIWLSANQPCSTWLKAKDQFHLPGFRLLIMLEDWKKFNPRRKGWDQPPFSAESFNSTSGNSAGPHRCLLECPYCSARSLDIRTVGKKTDNGLVGA